MAAAMAGEAVGSESKFKPFTREVIKSEYKVPDRLRVEVSDAALINFVHVLEHNQNSTRNGQLYNMILSMALELSGTTEPKLDNIFDTFTTYVGDYVKDGRYHFPLEVLTDEGPHEVPQELSEEEQKDGAKLTSYNKALAKHIAHSAIQPVMKFRRSDYAIKLSNKLQSSEKDINVRKYIGLWCLSHLRCLVIPFIENGWFYFHYHFLDDYGIKEYEFKMPPLYSKFYEECISFSSKRRSHAIGVLIQLVAVERDLQTNHLPAHHSTLRAIRLLVTDELYYRSIPAVAWADKAAALANRRGFESFLSRFQWEETKESVSILKDFHIKYRQTGEEEEHCSLQGIHLKIANILRPDFFPKFGVQENLCFVSACQQICRRLDCSGKYECRNIPIENESTKLGVKLGNKYVDDLYTEVYAREST